MKLGYYEKEKTENKNMTEINNIKRLKDKFKGKMLKHTHRKQEI
jgi:hypothetical protein